MASQDLNDSDPLQPSSDNAQLSSPGRHQAESGNETPQLESEQNRKESPAPANPKLQALADKKVRLEETLASLQAQRSALAAEAKLPPGLAIPESWTDEERTKSAMATANGVIKDHIALLHKYNEIKDIGQGLMGLIADKRGVRMATVMEEYGMTEKD